LNEYLKNSMHSSSDWWSELKESSKRQKLREIAQRGEGDEEEGTTKAKKTGRATRREASNEAPQKSGARKQQESKNTKGGWIVALEERP
jgi:hypothetical protein